MSQEPRPRSKIISPESTFRSTARTLSLFKCVISCMVKIKSHTIPNLF